MKKTLLCCFLVLLTAFAFAGGNRQSASAGGRTTIRVSGWDIGVDPTVSIYLQLQAEFERLNPTIAIEHIDTSSNDYTQRLTIMLNGGSDLDAIWIKDGDTTPAYAQRGQLVDLAPLMARDNVNPSLYSGGQNLVIGGRTVGLPLRTDYYVLFYNKDIFDQAGVPYPTNDMTWDQWEALCARLSSGTGTNRIYGGFLHTWNACVQNWGVQDGRNTILATDYSFFKPYYEMALRLQRSNYIWDYGALRSGGIGYGNAFLQGYVATLPMGTWFISTIINAEIEGSSRIRNWGVATLPHPSGVPAGYTVGSITPVSINQASSKRDAAWEYVKFITGEQGAKMFAANGNIPGRQSSEILATIAALPRMPQGIAEALAVRNISLDRPYDPMSPQVNQMLGEEHSLIMLEEVTVDQGLANMGRRSREIQGIR